MSADTRPALRFLTCGSVDDGTSTLIGHLLFEQNLIFDDHLAGLPWLQQTQGTEAWIFENFAEIVANPSGFNLRGSRRSVPCR